MSEFASIPEEVLLLLKSAKESHSNLTKENRIDENFEKYYETIYNYILKYDNTLLNERKEIAGEERICNSCFYPIFCYSEFFYFNNRCRECELTTCVFCLLNGDEIFTRVLDDGYGLCSICSLHCLKCKQEFCCPNEVVCSNCLPSENELSLHDTIKYKYFDNKNLERNSWGYVYWYRFHRNTCLLKKKSLFLFACRTNLTEEIVNTFPSSSIDEQQVGFNLAFEFRNFEVAQEIVKQGYDINALDKEGKNVLFYAIKNEDQETLNFLLDNGVDLNISYGQYSTCVSLLNEKVDKRLTHLNDMLEALEENEGDNEFIDAVKKDKRTCDVYKPILVKFYRGCVLPDDRFEEGYYSALFKFFLPYYEEQYGENSFKLLIEETEKDEELRNWYIKYWYGLCEDCGAVKIKCSCYSCKYL